MSHIVLTQIARRSKYPVPELGEDVYVRALTRGEIERIENMEKDAQKTDLMLAFVVIESTGNPAFAQRDDETDEQLAARVHAATLGWETPVISTISEAVQKIGKPPKAETVLKN